MSKKTTYSVVEVKGGFKMLSENKKGGNGVSLKSTIDKIVKRYKDRNRADIDNWKRALQMAELEEEPRLDYLHDLYDWLRVDAEFENVIELRKSATLNTPFNIVNEKSEINEEHSNIFKKEWFYNFLNDCLEAVIFGNSVMEFTLFDEKNIEYKLAPRGNVLPSQRAFIMNLEDPSKILDYTKIPTIIDVIDNNIYGKINSIVPNLIWARNTMQSWAEFCERFGIPMITAETIQMGGSESEAVMDMLEAMGESAFGLFPKGSEIKIHEANRTDAYQTFLNFIKINNDKIAKAIIGGTMLNTDGSSKSQSEVHERNLDRKISVSDRRKIEFIINDKLLPLLRMYGYKIGEDEKFVFDTTQQLDLKEHWSIVKEILPHYEVEQEWIEKTFQIPLKGKQVALAQPTNWR